LNCGLGSALLTILFSTTLATATFDTKAMKLPDFTVL